MVSKFLWKQSHSGWGNVGNKRVELDVNSWALRAQRSDLRTAGIQVQYGYTFYLSCWLYSISSCAVSLYLAAMKVLCIYSSINFVCLSKTSQWRKLCLNVSWHLWEVFFLSAHLLARSPAHTYEALTPKPRSVHLTNAHDGRKFWNKSTFSSG